MKDIILMIGEAVGQGIEWASRILGRTLLRSGFHMFNPERYEHYISRRKV
jgi:Pyruvate/2-oxoacid:ferredoxin oxidoreductase gamma subunit